jgi:RimJ/RimL family protein N-acetyltransferase
MIDPFVSRGEGQAFFVGPTVFLRPVDPEDAASAPVWSPDPFPKPAEVIEEQLKEQLGDDPDLEADQQRLLICRRVDDRPLGSVFFDYEHGRECTLWFTHDPNRSLDERAAVEAEVMTFTLPWLLEKRNLMKVSSDHLGDHPLIATTATRLGMRRCFRLREAYIYHGERYDRIGYELLDPRWIATLGMPRGMQEGPVERTVRAPAPGNWHPRGGPAELPTNAIISGDRLFLRPFEPEDGKLASRWLMQDTDDSFPNGPDVVNPWVYGQRHVALANESPPTWVRFAIVRNEDDQLIGANGIENLDLLHRTAETESTIFHPEFRNQGYGTEAKHLLLEYAFDRLGLHMVYSWVSEFNTRSAAALRKQGYREAGYFAWADLYQGNFTGGWYFDYLADEWRAARR